MAPKKDPKTAGQEFLDQLLAKTNLSDEERAAIRGKLATDDALTLAGTERLRHDEFSRLADDLRAKETAVLARENAALIKDRDATAYKGTLDSWYSQKLSDLQQAARLKAENEALQQRLEHDGSVAPDLTGYVKAADLQATLTDVMGRAERDALAVISATTNITARHLHEFNEVLKPEELFQHCRNKGLPLDLGYEDYIKDRVQERSQKDLDARITAAREEGRMAGLRERNPVAYPVGANHEPTTLDFLTGTAQPSAADTGVAAAVNDFYKGQGH